MLSCPDSRRKGGNVNTIKAAWRAFHKHRRWLTNRHLLVPLRSNIFDSVVSPTALFSLAKLSMTCSMISQIGIVQKQNATKHHRVGQPSFISLGNYNEKYEITTWPRIARFVLHD